MLSTFLFPTSYHPPSSTAHFSSFCFFPLESYHVSQNVFVSLCFKEVTIQIFIFWRPTNGWAPFNWDFSLTVSRWITSIVSIQCNSPVTQLFNQWVRSLKTISTVNLEPQVTQMSLHASVSYQLILLNHRGRQVLVGWNHIWGVRTAAATTRHELEVCLSWTHTFEVKFWEVAPLELQL